MNLWTLTINDDNGIVTDIFTTEAALDAVAHDWCAAHWAQLEMVGPMPDDWREATEHLYALSGFIDSIHPGEHEVDVGGEYNTELTPEGEQMVIPGCERNAAPGTSQLGLFS